MADFPIIPPLRQSTHEVLACYERYQAEIVQGQQAPDSLQSERGTNVHRVAAEYIQTCARYRVAADYALYERLAATAGPEAGPMLDRWVHEYQVDYDHVYGCEMTLAMDAELQPTTYLDQVTQLPGVHYTIQPASFSGTLDALYLSDDGEVAWVDDMKTHPRPFDADTFQGRLYSYMVMAHFPKVQKVTFSLLFVRYGTLRRSEVWTRQDMPEMAKELRRARARQIEVHTSGDATPYPGSHCAYCVKLAAPPRCSVAEFNPNASTNMEYRLRFNTWSAQHAKVNNQVMKDYVQQSGRPIAIRDANGGVTTYGPQEYEKVRYPLEGASIRLLNEWSRATGEDWKDWKLDISSTKLKARLKAKKREGLRAAFEDSVIEVEPSVRFGLKHSDGSVETGWEGEE